VTRRSITFLTIISLTILTARASYRLLPKVLP